MAHTIANCVGFDSIDYRLECPNFNAGCLLLLVFNLIRPASPEKDNPPPGIVATI